jgi:hypothetical protein
MVFGVAVVVASLIISALAAAVVDMSYRAIAERRWHAAVALVSVAMACVAASALG